MKAQIIKGNYWYIKFYNPKGKKTLHGHIYDNFTGKLLDKDIISNQEDYDFFIEMFTIADNHKSQVNNITPMFV